MESLFLAYLLNLFTFDFSVPDKQFYNCFLLFFSNLFTSVLLGMLRPSVVPISPPKLQFFERRAHDRHLSLFLDSSRTFSPVLRTFPLPLPGRPRTPGQQQQQQQQQQISKMHWSLWISRRTSGGVGSGGGHLCRTSLRPSLKLFPARYYLKQDSSSTHTCSSLIWPWTSVRSDPTTENFSSSVT